MIDITQTKTCIECGIEKPLNEFYFRKDNNRLRNDCKKCHDTRTLKWKRTHREQYNKTNRESKYRTGEVRGPARENPACANWLGDFAEDVLFEAFGAVQKMPKNFVGYDFICKNGYKIDAKSCCYSEKYDRWSFGIRGNDIADYLICVGFDSRKSLEPVRVWIIPNREFSGKSGITIHSKSRYNDYMIDISKIRNVCKIKKEST